MAHPATQADDKVLDLSGRLNQSLAEKERPEPGVYAGVPWEQYHAWDLASNSRLTKIRRSPAHLKAYLEERKEDTTALLIGRAVHSAILEPDDFTLRFTKALRCAANTKAGSQCSNSGIILTASGWRCGVHGNQAEAVPGGPTVIPGADYDAALRMRDAVFAHPRARALLTGEGQAELSLVWDCTETGVRCKARHDRHSPLIAGGAIIDIKTTRDASQREFERSIFTHGYHIQGAHYLDAARVLGLPAEHYVIVAVEKEAPFATQVFRLSEGAIDAGQEQLAVLKRRYAECLATDKWPGYSEDVQDIALPDWAWDRVVAEVGS